MKFSLRYLRFPEEMTRGRRYPEPPHPYRTEFQRDRDRIIHCRAFRRLENKTQVFSPDLSDHFRNRLTHTLEVAQLTRTVARVLELNEDLAEALALVHDVGHPPFGHAGEEELARQMRRFGERFEHNFHTLRIVESFEQRYAEFPGLNLTFEVREGIVKHSTELDPLRHPELVEYLPGLRPPLEAQLIDLVDEIAYNTADLDDGYSAGLVHVEQLCAEIPELADVYRIVARRYPHAEERILVLELVRRTVDTLVTGLIEGTYARVRAAGVETIDDLRAYPERLASFSEQARSLNRKLKHFLHTYVYCSPRLVEERREAARKVGELFNYFMTHPEDLPAAYKAKIGAEAHHRVVCDYIAGMTDNFFMRTYQRFIGDPQQPSMADSFGRATTAR